MASTSSAAVSMIGPWSPDKKFSDPERWICLYPAYINKKKTLAEGRRLPRDKCVENPTAQEMRDVLAAVGLNVGIENKAYSREPSKELSCRGRIRVQLKNDDGSLCNANYSTRESVMYHLTDMIPKLKVRQPKPEQQSSAKGKGKGKGKR